MHSVTLGMMMLQALFHAHSKFEHDKAQEPDTGLDGTGIENDDQLRNAIHQVQVSAPT